MSKPDNSAMESLEEVTTLLRKAGFKVLLLFSVLILAVIALARPDNVYVACFYGFSWLLIAFLGLSFPMRAERLSKLWALLTIPFAPFLVASNGLMPATLVPIATIFPILLLSSWWRKSAMVILAGCTLLVPFYGGEFDKGLWLRLCVTNIVVSLLIYALASKLEAALVDSRRKSVELKSALEKEKQALATQSQFLATMSHEIRTPLNGILGLTDVMLSHDLTEKARPHLEKIQRSGVSLNRILNDVLDLSKLNAGKLALEAVSFDLVSTAKDCMTFYSQLADKKGLTLHLDIDSSIRRYVVGDVTRLSQVLNNLISNAIKFTEKGSVSLCVCAKASSKTHQFVQFIVADTGSGIAQSEQARVFDAFTQANSSIARHHGGTGLGLQIVKSLVEAMGGTVFLKSEVGKGSEFSFELPFAPAQRNMPSLKIESVPMFSNNEVLVAEDNEINQVVAKSLLEDAGIRVTLAKNGVEAQEKALARSFDLILMDLHMPEMNGVEATQIIRSKGITTPVLAFTAAVVADEIDVALASGMNGYITKPVNKNELYGLLSQYLNDVSNERRKNE